jgi:hypothetical protein
MTWCSRNIFVFREYKTEIGLLGFKNDEIQLVICKTKLSALNQNLFI